MNRMLRWYLLWRISRNEKWIEACKEIIKRYPLTLTYRDRSYWNEKMWKRRRKVTEQAARLLEINDG